LKDGGGGSSVVVVAWGLGKRVEADFLVWGERRRVPEKERRDTVAAGYYLEGMP
jgi:hypothetical protein